jgi:predicted unusual protein kinase regulating ubiquinone biosynthesis (AarF/ABC1/UbiB family)
MVGRVAGRAAIEGAKQIASGQRPHIQGILLTPANASLVADRLAHMRGAALKLGQMVSMDVGVVLPPALAHIMARLRDDAEHMPETQLRDTLAAQWGSDWRDRFSRFDMKPFAAASIGQVHRATTTDGRELAIKVQYPGVRDSIDSDIDNAAAILRLPGVLPRSMNIEPLLAEAKQQLRIEADYVSEAAHLNAFRAHLNGSATFILPETHADLSSDTILAMTYLHSEPLDQLVSAPQALRDRVATALIELVLQELFVFGAMQTDPNLANYRWMAREECVVLLDFGAVRHVSPSLAAAFRQLLNAGLTRQRQTIRLAMQEIGYFDSKVAAHHQSLIIDMFDTAMVPFRRSEPFDFGQTDLLEKLRDMGVAMGGEKDLTHVPPAETLFLHRKIGGMYLLAAKLRARVDLAQMAERYRVG